MTISSLHIDSIQGPRYRAIATALAEKITTGEWEHGHRLPTHRELASTLGVTVGTVTRAYAELERRGLIRGEVGRGTFVGGASEDLLMRADDPDDSVIDLARNYPAPGAYGADLAHALRELADDPAAVRLLDYQSHMGRQEHREAAAKWISSGGYDVAPGRVVITAGAQHGLLAALSTVLSPGDRLGVEALSFPGTKSVARMLGCRLEPIAMDDEGILPDALAAACRDGVRVICSVPTLHNPTNAVMSHDRRRAIADVIAEHDAYLIEDDIFGLLLDEPCAPIASLIPANTLYLTSLSKTVAPGLRIGYLVPPPVLLDRVSMALRTTCWMAPPVMAEIATRWINDGTAASILVRHRREAAARMSLARDILGPCGARGADAPTGAMHIWFHLPQPWTTSTFVAAALERGVALTTEEPFVVTRGESGRALRICLGTPASRESLETALLRLAEILRAGPDDGAEVSIV